MFRLAHVSDLHATRVRFRARELPSLCGKRGMGWLSWCARRRHEYRPELFGLMSADVVQQSPDQIAVTGDLTHLGLESELLEASQQLRAFGEPRAVHVVPGNHDAYHNRPGGEAWREWLPYLAGDAGGTAFPEFPTVRIRGDVALIGLSTAVPTRWPLASGVVGARQLARLGDALGDLGRRSLCRVLLLHHPPLDSLASRRRGLTDAARLREVLAGEGAELVLHGHVHRTCFARLRGPDGDIPSVGVRAFSARGGRPSRRAQYHLFRIRRAQRGFAIDLEVRGLAPDADRVVRLAEHQL